MAMTITKKINDNNNSNKFFIIYVPNQLQQGQLQTQHRVNAGNYIKDKHSMKAIAHNKTIITINFNRSRAQWPIFT
jgi:hypothetical protein